MNRCMRQWMQPGALSADSPNTDSTILGVNQRCEWNPPCTPNGCSLEPSLQTPNTTG